ncbi:hypothetical protein CAQU_06615 [Corynebacterium aquilae DSM 44791]|uniref:ABC transporter domain-containing protein n=1 Tax=Corynebacterium aquilae DSM 44791 TaxID=1431546 RepID=A0A1L7CFZ2_9CORY|nr:hypothetical protein CAQU_06615 [Corynebacterium aquilae DSM 44791]
MHVRLGGRDVLTDITVDFAPGELVGLIGPNGAGKTTLLRCLSGAIAPRRGTVHCPRRAVGYVPQRAHVAWDFPISVFQAVLNGRAHLHKFRPAGRADYEHAHQALARTAMAELADRSIAELSGGQRQRVLIARALACNPRVLLLDEPLTGLDVPNQEMLGDLVKQLSHGGTTIIMATHDLGQAVDLCDKLLILKGTVHAYAPPQDLKDPELWQRVFGVSADAALLRTVGART